jgi:Undecaprenyl-phosphate galactose phosphotransferase WbaP
LILAGADATGLTLAFVTGGIVTLLFSPYLTATDPHRLLALGAAAGRPTEIAFFSAALLVWLLREGHYTDRLPFWVETRQVILGCLAILLCDGFLQYALKHSFSRLWLLHTWVLAIPAILAMRWTIRTILDSFGLWDIPVLVVGQPDGIAAAIRLIRAERHLGYRVAGTESLETMAGASAEDWAATCARHGARRVILADKEADAGRQPNPVAGLVRARIPFVSIHPLTGLPVLSLKSYPVLGQDVLLLVEPTRLNGPGRVAKLVFDRINAAILLIVLSPLLATLALLIRRDGGPVFYGQSRIGHRGRPFSCLKFRTMVVDADAALAEALADPGRRAEWIQSHKMRDDPRITPLGRIMRAYSLDELPQLLNVLKGEMSLVGPRPIVADECPRFGDDLADYLETLPGITGLWQASGRNALDYGERVRLNSWYVRNWSLWLDLVILLKTIPAVFRRDGAF